MSVFLYKFRVGNHRVILVDLNLDQIVQQSTTICTPSMWRLICENENLVETCNNLAMSLLTSNKIKQCLEQLEALLESIDIDSWCVKLNMIDEKVTEILLCAEKKCRKLQTGEVEYSSEVSETAEKWHAWRMALRISQGVRMNTRAFHRLASK